MESGMSTAVLGTTESTGSGPFVTTAPAVSTSFANSVRHGIDIVIAFHRHEDLVAPLVDSLVACVEELQGLGAGLILINDSPDHEPLKPAIESARQRLGLAGLPVAVVSNAMNLGFVRSANIGLARAREGGRDALLLNSDTQVFPGAIAEMVRVASLDPMIGFVSPRSNNATIASLPTQEEYHHQSPAVAHEMFRRLSPHLPEYHRAPTCIGFCFLVRHPILARFGLFDESYGAGYSEENDLVMRAGRHGYRAVLANRAFVHHRGNTSFGPEARQALEGRNSRLLAERYPEYPLAVRAYLAGPVHRAERMLAGLLPDASGRFDVLFDLSDTGGEDGAFEKAKEVLDEIAVRHAGDFNLFAMVPAGHAVARRLGAIAAVQVVPTDTDRIFAVGLRFGRPLTRESVLRLNRLAVRTAWFMRDTTAQDCRSGHDSDLDWARRQVFQHGDCVVSDGGFNRPHVALPAGAAPERAWTGSADEVALLVKELLGRPDAFGPLLRRLADMGPASSAQPVGGTGRRDYSGTAEQPGLAPALRRFAARFGTAFLVGPLRFVWHAWYRGVSRPRRERY
jgi:GT2 family glycosyltransferase